VGSPDSPVNASGPVESLIEFWGEARLVVIGDYLVQHSKSHTSTAPLSELARLTSLLWASDRLALGSQKMQASLHEHVADAQQR